MKTTKTLRILSAALVALMIVFAPMSCKKEVKTVDMQGVEKVIVLVTDIKTGEPVANASVKVLEYQLVTDAEGKVLFELPSNEIRGDINLVVRKNGYASAGHSLAYAYLKENRNLTMYMKPVETVQLVSPAGGTITDQDNNEVIIPDGALDAGAQVFMDVQPFTSLPGTGELFPVMSMELQSAGAELKKPVEIRFAAPKGSEFEQGLEVPLLYFDEAEMTWKDSGQKLTAGPKGTYLTATITKMRTYAAGKWQDWQLITYLPLKVTEVSRNTIYSSKVCRYLYGWRDGPDHDMGKGNDKFSGECTSGSLMGGHADHGHNITLSPLPPAVAKLPGITAVVNAAIKAVQDELYTLVPPPPGAETNYRLKIGYQVCLEVCWCRKLDLDQFRNQVSYTALPVFRIKVGGTTYDIPFLTATAAYNNLEVKWGEMSEMDKSECHEGGGGEVDSRQRQ